MNFSKNFKSTGMSKLEDYHKHNQSSGNKVNYDVLQTRKNIQQTRARVIGAETIDNLLLQSTLGKGRR